MIRIAIVKPHDARAWIGLGVYVLVLLLLGMMWTDKALLKDDFFKTIATLIIGTGFINGPVGWAYQATKGGSEMAESSARIAEKAAGIAPGHEPAPENVEAAAQDTADAAQKKADAIKGKPGA